MKLKVNAIYNFNTDKHRFINVAIYYLLHLFKHEEVDKIVKKKIFGRGYQNK